MNQLPDVIFVRQTTARDIKSPYGAGKKDHMRENTRAYEIKLSDGTTETIMAASVEETPTRVRLLGHVPGQDDFVNSGEVIKSFRDSDVVSYRAVPVPEQNDRAVGKHTYRVNHLNGRSRDVKADAVTHAPGIDGGTGRYALVTNLKNHGSRTEYVVPEESVVSIERLGAVDEAKVSVVAQKTA